jgi:hypothetical protein
MKDKPVLRLRRVLDGQRVADYGLVDDSVTSLAKHFDWMHDRASKGQEAKLEITAILPRSK